LQKFQYFLKRVQFGINKGLEVNLATTKIKKEVEVDFDAREVKIEVLITLEIKEEIKIILITFAIKEAIEKFKVVEIVYRKIRSNWHTKANTRIHNQIFKLPLLSLGSIIITLQVPSHFSNNMGCRFPFLPS
jgi:hypothetical protein